MSDADSTDGRGRLALVTGASSGIGEATVRLLARRGWRLVLVARRGDRLDALAAEIGGATTVAVDLTDADAPERVREVVEREGPLHFVVNNAGSSWRATFAEGGYENVRRTMDVNFDAVVRLSEALLPLLRDAAPSAMVNVSSTAGRIARPGVGAYSASKFALAGWTDAVQLEEAANGVHVGLVLPGFVATEGFPQRQLVDNPRTRWIVSKPERVAEAILRAGPGGKPEVYVPRVYGLVPRLRHVVPALSRRAVSGGGI
jgi:short-subunit dehydrogenase